MFGFLCQHYHFPRSPEDRLVAQFLPEFNVELAVWKLAFNEPGLPFRLRLVFISHRDARTFRIILCTMMARKGLCRGSGCCVWTIWSGSAATAR